MPSDIASLIARVGIATALVLLAGCGEQVREQPSEHEAYLSCYWPAEDHADDPQIQAVLADGMLSEDECREVVQPFVDADLTTQTAKARKRAVAAALRAMQDQAK